MAARSFRDRIWAPSPHCVWIGRPPALGCGYPSHRLRSARGSSDFSRPPNWCLHPGPVSLQEPFQRTAWPCRPGSGSFEDCFACLPSLPWHPPQGRVLLASLTSFLAPPQPAHSHHPQSRPTLCVWKDLPTSLGPQGCGRATSPVALGPHVQVLAPFLGDGFPHWPREGQPGPFSGHWVLGSPRVTTEVEQKCVLSSAVPWALRPPAPE